MATENEREEGLDGRGSEHRRTVHTTLYPDEGDGIVSESTLSKPMPHFNIKEIIQLN
jgi:hypothetical protein